MPQNPTSAVAQLLNILDEYGAGVLQMVGREEDETPLWGVFASRVPALVDNLDRLADASNETDDESLAALCRTALFDGLHLYEIGGLGECEVILAKSTADVAGFGGDPATARKLTLDEARKVYGNEGELTLYDVALAHVLAGRHVPAQLWTCHA